MMKVAIQEKFNTAMGLILQVKNDRIFKVDDVLDTEDGKYRIDRIAFSSNPDNDGFVNLFVSKS